MTGSQDPVATRFRPNSKDRGERQDREKLTIARCFGLLRPLQTTICMPINQAKPSTGSQKHFETVSLPVAEILSPAARQEPTKCSLVTGKSLRHTHNQPSRNSALERPMSMTAIADERLCNL